MNPSKPPLEMGGNSSTPLDKGGNSNSLSAKGGMMRRLIGPSIQQTIAAADRPSLIGLLVANLFPIVMALVFRWDIGGVVMFYWWENIVIGGYAILRIIFAQGRFTQGRFGQAHHQSKFFLVPFFCFHYFFFCFVHGMFLLVFLSGDFIRSPFDDPATSFRSPLSDGPLSGNVFWMAWDALPQGGVLSILILIGSHGISFARNYLVSGENKKSTPIIEMFRPYGRVVLLHICIIFGGFVTLLFGSPLLMVVLLMMGKTALDVGVHSVSHGVFSRMRQEQAANGVK